MPNLKSRSYKSELLDNDDIPFEDIKQNMRELNTVNSLLGGHAITLAGVKSLLPSNRKEKIQICEIGCGGGDNLHAIAAHFITNNNISFIGIDIKQSCISFAKEQYPKLNATWICSDYAAVDFAANKPTIIFSSLFCHHFKENDLVQMLGWMRTNSTAGFFINDLHRHIIAYYSIKWITSVFSKSYLVKNDAPLSVARGFKAEEWIKIFTTAGIDCFHLQWKWAFRHLIVYKHAASNDI